MSGHNLQNTAIKIAFLGFGEVAQNLRLWDHLMPRLDRLINQHTVHGPGYNTGTQANVETEEFSNITQ